MMKGMVFAERYKLEDFIGQGGMSLVSVSYTHLTLPTN